MNALDNPYYDDWKLNPPEPEESHFKCEHCHEEFQPGDKVYNIEGDLICYECAWEWLDNQSRLVKEEECYGD